MNKQKRWDNRLLKEPQVQRRKIRPRASSILTYTRLQRSLKAVRIIWKVNLRINRLKHLLIRLSSMKKMKLNLKLEQLVVFGSLQMTSPTLSQTWSSITISNRSKRLKLFQICGWTSNSPTSLMKETSTWSLQSMMKPLTNGKQIINWRLDLLYRMHWLHLQLSKRRKIHGMRISNFYLVRERKT